MVRRIILAASALAALCAVPALAADETPRLRSFVGLQGLLAAGVHSDVAGRQTGIGGGPLVQLTYVANRRVFVHVEGIPVVSAPQRASAFYGQATPALGIFLATARFAAGARSNYWIGVGTTIINQRTPLPNISQVASSRLAGGRYEVFARVPMRNARFVEGLIGVSPRLHGSDHFLYSDGSRAVNKDEAAAEEDFSVALGVERHNSAFLFGVRSLNFSAVFTRTGLAADRNNAAGVTLEFRRYLSP